MVTRSGEALTLRVRAARVRLVLTDCDGVLTDAGVWYGPHGELLKRFSMRDGMGVERLRTVARIPVGILTKERSAIVAARARILRIDEVHLGVADKLARAEGIARARGLTLGDVAYIGDDVNDLDLLHRSGLSACPADAEPVVAEAVHFLCRRDGGHGAFREFAELIVEAQMPTAVALPERAADPIALWPETPCVTMPTA